MTQPPEEPPQQPSSNDPRKIVYPSLPPQPPKPPLPLNYRTPRLEPPRNSPGLFFGRMAIGCGWGVVSVIFGAVAAYQSEQRVPNSMWFAFFTPLTISVIIALGLTVWRRRYGYVTGIIIAPFLVAVVLGTLLWIACGSGSPFR